MFDDSDVVHSESRSDKAKRAISEYLDEYEQVRATELKKEVCDEREFVQRKYFTGVYLNW